MGLSVAGVVSQDMVKKMAKKPIIFAMANPDPEITYHDAVAARPDAIVATGRSDFPNQVNNVLGFPFIFRGALDVRATSINDEMKMAAAKALAQLAREKVPEMVIKAYGGQEFSFGKDYIIPKPFDPRVLWTVAPAVAKAAIESGVAKKIITDWKAYEEELKERLGISKEILRMVVNKAIKQPKKIVFPEGKEEKIILAASSLVQSGIAYPILIGDEKLILSKFNELKVEKNNNILIIDPLKSDKLELYAKRLYEKRNRKGMTLPAAFETVKQPIYFAAMMVDSGDADGLIGGLTTHYPATIKPALECIGVKEEFSVVSGLYIIIAKNEVYFFADTTVNINPDSEQLAQIAIAAADTVKEFEIMPRVAMLSFSNFGSSRNEYSEKVRKAVEIVRKKRPDILIDGEMQADTALSPDILKNDFPFSPLKLGANVLIFPDLNSGNIAYKLMAKLGQATVVGPILMGMKKSAHVLQRGSSIDDIINMTAIAVVDAQSKQ